MMLFKTHRGPALLEDEKVSLLAGVDWDALFREAHPGETLRRARKDASVGDEAGLLERALQAPIGSQEVWAAGVTYFRSRDARMEEARDAGGGDFYARVYEADRPELFFKASAHRVVGHGQPVRIRRDATWSVPEPELTAVVNSEGRIFGYTIGNDMSSRDIEGANPLYLPQAKTYDGSCALGPGILLTDEPLAPTTAVVLSIHRDGATAFSGETQLAQLKRSPASLVEWLFRECAFPNGCFLLTGTGIVPPDDFTLRKGDEIRIRIDALGTLVNTVA